MRQDNRAKGRTVKSFNPASTGRIVAPRGRFRRVLIQLARSSPVQHQIFVSEGRNDAAILLKPRRSRAAR